MGKRKSRGRRRIDSWWEVGGPLEKEGKKPILVGWKSSRGEN